MPAPGAFERVQQQLVHARARFRQAQLRQQTQTGRKRLGTTHVVTENMPFEPLQNGFECAPHEQPAAGFRMNDGTLELQVTKDNNVQAHLVIDHKQGVSVELLCPVDVSDPARPRLNDLYLIESPYELQPVRTHAQQQHASDASELLRVAQANQTKYIADQFMGQHSRVAPDAYQPPPTAAPAPAPQHVARAPTAAPPLPTFKPQKMAPITNVADQQPHACVARYFAQELHEELPWWFACTFQECLQDARALELYRGTDFYYVWHPHTELAREEQVHHRTYCALVNRIDYAERLLQKHADGRRQMEDARALPQRIAHQIVQMQDTHHMLALFMSDTQRYSDVAIQEAASDLARAQYPPRAGTSEERGEATASELLHHTWNERSWEHMRRVQEHACDVLGFEPHELAKRTHRTRLLDLVMPSYQLVFHEGELPDLSVLLRHIGLYSAPTLEDLPFERDEEVCELVDILNKALFEPMKLRGMAETCCEKGMCSLLVYECLVRMTMAWIGGYYHHADPTSFFTRQILYRFMAYQPPSRSEFCQWMRKHTSLALNKLESEDVMHNKITLMILKEYVVAALHKTPWVTDFMKRVVARFPELVCATQDSTGRARAFKEDAWFGCGPAHERFHLAHDTYVLRKEDVKIRSKLDCMDVRDGDGRTFTQSDASTPPAPASGGKQKTAAARARSALRASATPDTGEFSLVGVGTSARTQAAKKRNAIRHPDAPATQSVAPRTRKRAQSDAPVVQLQRPQGPPEPPPMPSLLFTGPHLNSVQNKTRVQRQLSLRPFVRACMLFLMQQAYAREGDHRCALELEDQLIVSKEWIGRGGSCMHSAAAVMRQTRLGQQGWHPHATSHMLTVIDLCINRTLYRAECELAHEHGDARMRMIDADGTLSLVLRRRFCRLLFEQALVPDSQFDRALRERRLSWAQVLQMYVAQDDRLSTRGLMSDHRHLLYPLHARSLVLNGTRCECFQCHRELDAHTLSDRDLYREFQRALSSGELGQVALSAPVLDLLERVHEHSYDKMLRYMYRVPSTNFIANVVQEMAIAKEDNKHHPGLIRAARALTECERRLVTCVAHRIDKWGTCGLEWMEHILKMNHEPIVCLLNARSMFNTRTYPVDVRSCVRDMATSYERDFLLLEQFFAELHRRQSVSVFQLPYHWTRQQACSAHENYNMVEYGEPLPDKVHGAYFCTEHGDVKQTVARDKPAVVRSFGTTIGAATCPSTGRVYCSMVASRCSAKAKGSLNDMHRVGDRLTGVHASMDDCAYAHADASALVIGSDDNDQEDDRDAEFYQRRFRDDPSVDESGVPLPRDALDDAPLRTNELRNALSSLRSGRGASSDDIAAAEEEYEEERRHQNACDALQMDMGSDDDDDPMDADSDDDTASSSADNPVSNSERVMVVRECAKPTRGRGPSACSRARSNEQEKVRRATEASLMGRAALGSTKQHRYKMYIKMLRNNNCFAPLYYVNMLGRALQLHNRVYMMCPVCGKCMELNARSYGWWGIPTCHLCTLAIRERLPQRLAAYVRARCYRCTETAALHELHQVHAYLVLDDTGTSVSSMRYIFLCKNHNNMPHIGDNNGTTRLTHVYGLLWRTHRLMRDGTMERGVMDARVVVRT